MSVYVLESFDYLFFFQAEDGIRDVAVTGVQTCALPISLYSSDGQKWNHSTSDLSGCKLEMCTVCNTRGCFSSNGVISRDRKSTRLNSSHGYISYAVFCLKKKNNAPVLGHALGAHLTHPE